MLTVEILVSTMYETDYSLLEKINVQSDAIVVNQCNRENINKFIYENNRIIWIDTKERGVSNSRNLALSMATADICLLVDADEQLVDDYVHIIQKSFGSIKKADLIIYNIQSIGNIRKRYFNTKVRKLHIFNIMRYGAARIAFRREKIIEKGVFFNTKFGPGAEISCGEDSLFLNDCLKQFFYIISYPETIANIDDHDSTWFKGYNNNYFIDKGALFYAISSRWCDLLILQHILRHGNQIKELGGINALMKMIEGKKKQKEYGKKYKL